MPIGPVSHQVDAGTRLVQCLDKKENLFLSWKIQVKGSMLVSLSFPEEWVKCQSQSVSDMQPQWVKLCSTHLWLVQLLMLSAALIQWLYNIYMIMRYRKSTGTVLQCHEIFSYICLFQNNSIFRIIAWLITFVHLIHGLYSLLFPYSLAVIRTPDVVTFVYLKFSFYHQFRERKLGRWKYCFHHHQFVYQLILQ